MKLAATLTILLVILFIFISRISFGESEDDDDDEHEYKFWQKKPGVKPVSNVLYQDECGACHFTYQPGLLPSGSWKKIMTNLEDHFGDNAELDPADNLLITTYLKNNSAEKSSFRRSVKIMRSLGSSSFPGRITQIPYFVREHDEIPARLVNNNPKVASLALCDKCHQTANKGIFSESKISIPGYGQWDD